MAEGTTHTRKKAKRGRGRPPHEYSPEIITLLETVPPPATVTDICEVMGVSVATFYKWLKEEEDFSKAVMRVREAADDQVVNALYKRAIGYEYVEVTDRSETGTGADGGPIDKQVQIVTPKHMPADPGSIMNWLKNRQPDDWRDKKVVEVEGDHVALLEKVLKDRGEE